MGQASSQFHLDRVQETKMRRILNYVDVNCGNGQVSFLDFVQTTQKFMIPLDC